MKHAPFETGPVQHAVRGLTVTVSVSPCSWMHATYGLQLHFQLPCDNDAGRPNGGLFMNLKKPWADLTRGDYDRLVGETLATLARDGLKSCTSCGTPTWNAAAFGQVREDGRCSRCFMRALDKEFEQSNQREAARIRRQDREMVRKGYTHRVDAWIHPEAGDDEQVSWYARRVPSSATVRERLRKLGSTAAHDFTVTALNDATAG